jgi:SET domain-containing protein
MMLVRCYLAPSEIDGLGVFCRDDIKAGQNVWRYENLLDIRIALADLGMLKPHAREFVERYAYPDFTDPAYLILESDEGRFMHHAEVPNIDFSDGAHGLARWDIPAGTELTCDKSTFATGRIRTHRPHLRQQALAL